MTNQTDTNIQLTPDLEEQLHDLTAAATMVVHETKEDNEDTTERITVLEAALDSSIKDTENIVAEIAALEKEFEQDIDALLEAQSELMDEPMVTIDSDET